MDLYSCDNCGVVLDKDKLEFPSDDDIWDVDGNVIIELATIENPGWNYVPAVRCPVCGTKVPKN